MRYKIEIENLETNSFYILNNKLFLQLLDLINVKPSWKKLLLTSEYQALNGWIFKCVPKLASDFYTYETRIYWIFNDLHEFPRCKNPKCDTVFHDRNVFTIRKGYPNYCTHKCAVNSDEIKRKSVETCMRKYGTSSPGQAESVKAKSRNTCFEKYGVEFSFQAADVKEKIKNTCLEKYGFDKPVKSDEIQNKIRKTKVEKYGDMQPWHSKESLEKRRETWKKIYGADHPVKTQYVKNKMRATTISNYGAEYWSQTDEFRLNKLRLSYEKNILNSEYDEPCFSLQEYQHRTDHNEIFQFKCKKCGFKFESKHRDGHHGLCPKCFPHIQSKAEIEIVDFINRLNFETITHDRKLITPYELDIYVPAEKLAIEFNGLYWHSETSLLARNNDTNPKTYHLTKTEECEKNGIQLIHIFENEWMTNRAIVESRIKNLLGRYDKTIYARKCEIKDVDSKLSKTFQSENHIQGAVNASVNLGLFYNDKLISLMTFGKCRFDEIHEWEMLRFCNKLGYHIPGAASRLLMYFEKTYKPKSLVSYADRRWSRGKLYKTLGFIAKKNSPPNYWYFYPSDGILLSRIRCQKHKLPKLLENFDPLKTEVENMKANGYFRIFDCGNMVFEKTYS